MSPARAALAAETRDWDLTRERLLWLAAGLALVLLPHAARVPLWITGGFALLVGWRLIADRRGVEPPRLVVIGLTLSMLPGVYLSYGTLLGRNAGVALLVVLAGMKLLETRTIRDAYVVIFLGFFLVITNFLFSQSIPNGLYMIVVVLVLTAAMMTMTVESTSLNARRRVLLAGQLLLQAVPVMLLLFVLFPRISAPLWGLPKDAHSGRSGLSDSMSPGQISNLSLSDEVAFRVKFLNGRPDPRDLYWRGPVLWTTDGQTWRGRKAGRSIRPMYSEARGRPLDYEVTLEPHDRRWLFALDVPSTIPPRGQMTEDFENLSVKAVRERQQYLMRSYPSARMRRLSIDQRELGLALPENRHARARETGAAWRRSLSDDRAIVERALSYFNEQPFFYTLQPPLLAQDNVDQFLFETRAGFCEHYAGAFTVLMRAAGVPTRIVTGYQGGQYNALGDYLVVRQRDAHAWVEVWFDDDGWTRVDPTAAVAPDRIERGVDAVLPRPIGPRALGIQPSEPVRRAWSWFRQGVDAMNNGWNQWVLAYGARRQERLLRAFGLDSRNYLAVSLVLALGIGVSLAVVFVLMSRRKESCDPAVKVYRKYCDDLARHGFVRRPDEGPQAFAARVSDLNPTWRHAIEAVTESYIDIRYGYRSDALEELKVRAKAAGRVFAC